MKNINITKLETFIGIIWSISVLLIFIYTFSFGFKAGIREAAQKYLNNQLYEKALKFCDIGLKISPRDKVWYSIKGAAKFYLGDYAGAIEDYDLAYKIDIGNNSIMSFDNKIFIKYFLHDYKSALIDFDNAIDNAEDSNEKDQLLWDKAQFLYNIKEYHAALLVYDELIDKAENDRIFLLKDRLYLERALVNKELGDEVNYKNDLFMSGTNEEDMPENIIPQPILISDDN